MYCTTDFAILTELQSSLHTTTKRSREQEQKCAHELFK